MLTLIGLASLLPTVILIVLLNFRIYNDLKDTAHHSTRAAAESCALQIEAFLDRQFASLRTLVHIAEGYELYPPESRRLLFSDMVRRSLIQNRADILAAWMQMEPGALRDDPDKFHGTPLTAPNGGFDATWYYSGGILQQGTITDETYLGDFYQLPKQTGLEMVLDPYFYSYSGRADDTILETSLCIPIYSDNKFMGVAGFDIDLLQLQPIIESLEVPYGGHIILVNGSTGMQLSHPETSAVGELFGEELPRDDFEKIMYSMRDGNSFAYDKLFSPTSGWMLIQFTPVSLGKAGGNWYVALFLPMENVYRDINSNIRWQLVFSAAAFLLIFILISLSARVLSRPVIDMVALTEAMASGEFKGRLAYHRSDELGRLAESFNNMADTVQHYLARYEEINRDLEDRVDQRTSELEQSMKTLELTRDKVIETEKLAVLGRLAANIAHELNTPLGAIESSLNLIERSGPQLLETSFSALVKIAPEDKDHLRALFTHAGNLSREIALYGDRKARREMAGRFEELGVEDANSLADSIITYGLAEEEQRIARLVKNGQFDLLNGAMKVVSIIQALTIIRQAATKASITVAAVGSYSRKTHQYRMEKTDPVREIENLLIIYYNTLKQGVTIKRNFLSSTAVSANKDQLNQVLVNLINNALQAMSYKGELTLETADEGEMVRISVGDNGPGIPEAIKEQIFDPFFSTKQEGTGTGLGLDICRSIINGHEGRIEFTSSPGNTVFSVYLQRFTEEVPGD